MKILQKGNFLILQIPLEEEEEGIRWGDENKQRKKGGETEGDFTDDDDNSIVYMFSIVVIIFGAVFQLCVELRKLKKLHIE
jgi:hypothetical protein